MWVSLILLVIILIGGYWSYQHFYTHESVPARHVQLTAVGDSLTYGMGDPTHDGGFTSLIRKKVNRQANHVVMSTTNYGISGQTTSQINHRVMTSKSLRRSLKHADVITITTGGNDVLHFLKQHLTTTSQRSLTTDLTGYVAAYKTRVASLLTNIRRINASAPIFVFGIYNPVYVYFPQVAFISHAISLNNQTTKQVVAANHRAYFISIDHQLSDGQYTTTKSRAKLKRQADPNSGGSMTAGDLAKLLNGTGTESNRYLSNEDHFHPNKKGYQIMTNLLYQQMVRHIDWLKE